MVNLKNSVEILSTWNYFQQNDVIEKPPCRSYYFLFRISVIKHAVAVFMSFGNTFTLPILITKEKKYLNTIFGLQSFRKAIVVENFKQFLT